MTYKLLTAAALSLSLGTAVAFAQGDAGPEAPAGPPADWDPAVSEAFFSDSEAGTLRTADEARTNWATLSPEQQDAVRAHCEEAATDGAPESAPATPAPMDEVCDWVGTF